MIDSLEKRGSGSREGRLTWLRQWQSPRGPPVGMATSLGCAWLDGPDPPGGRREKACRYVPDVQFLRSPKIPVAIQHVRVPILLDTGAEISILSTRFVQDLFTNVELSPRFRTVCNLGGGLVPVQGPIELTVEVCGLMLEHPFFYYEGNGH